MSHMKFTLLNQLARNFFQVIGSALDIIVDRQQK